MALSLVQHKTAAWVSGTAVACTITASGANNLIVVSETNDTNRTVTSITDGVGNTYVQLSGALNQPDTVRTTDIWYCLKATNSGATTITVNFSGALDATCTVFVHEVSGFTTAAADGANVASDSIANPVGGSVTTTGTVGFLVGVLWDNNSITANPAAANEFTTGGDNVANGGRFQAACSFISSTAAAHNPAWTATANSWVSSTGAFKETAAASTTHFLSCLGAGG